MTDRKLPAQPWLTAPETRAVFAALNTAPATVRFVGGCVRNALLGEPVSDIDLATVHTPDRVIERLDAAGIKSVPTGIEHGTITAICNRTPFEVTTLRKDVTTDGRRATVAFTTDWAEDAARRDFTMNALYADADGKIYDPVGGVADLDARRIRFIGDADQRIREDYLRILRFFRFFTWYGGETPDSDGLRACAALKQGIDSLSGERIQAELKKILAAPRAIAGLNLMASTGILRHVLPEIDAADHSQTLDRVARLAAIDAAEGLDPDPVLRLAIALGPAAGAVEAVSTRLKLSNADRDRMHALAVTDAQPVTQLTAKEVAKQLYRLGCQKFWDRTLTSWADDPDPAHSGQWRDVLAAVKAWHRPTMPVTGAQLIAAGVPHGPQVGKILRAFEDWWIDTGFPDDAETIDAELSRLLTANGVVKPQ